MRASHEGRHVSGAERLVPLRDATEVVATLLDRGWHAAGADRVVLSLDDVSADDIRAVPALPARTVDVRDHVEGQSRAAQSLSDLGVSPPAISAGLTLLNDGPHPNGGVMRGAVIMDRLTGERMEPDQRRGVRVSRVDMTPADRRRIDPDGRRQRFVDALILASKVAGCLGVVADLGWSDDPDYSPGYVASRSGGYVRFTRLKERGSAVGGRVYFVDRATFEVGRAVTWLETKPTMVATAVSPRAPSA